MVKFTILPKNKLKLRRVTALLITEAVRKFRAYESETISSEQAAGIWAFRSVEWSNRLYKMKRKTPKTN